MLPVATIIGLQTGLLLSGAILTETVFAFGGMGSFMARRRLQPRLPGHPGRHPVPGGRLRAGQPARRHLLRPHRPAGADVVSRTAERGDEPAAEAVETSVAHPTRPPAALGARRAAPAAPQPDGDRRRGPGDRCSCWWRSSRRCSRRTARPRSTSPTSARGSFPGPSAEHLLGLDQLGRDELSRIIYGARYSLLIGVVSLSLGATGRHRARACSPAPSAAGSTAW